MAKRKERPITDEQANEVFACTKALPAGVTLEELDAIEARFAGVSDRATRRSLLLTLSRPASYVFEQIEQDRTLAVAFAQANQHGEEYVRFLKAIVSLIETASARIMVAQCAREDIKAVLAEAKETL